MSEFYIAVDIGATNTRVALGGKEGIIDKVVFKTPQEGDELTIARRIYEVIKQKYDRKLGSVRAIGVGTVGPLDLRKGKVTGTPNIGIHVFEIRDPLKEWLGKPVYVLNDAVAGVLGEKWFGIGKPYHNLVYITISTGIGGGIIVDDHLLLGKMGNAHEIGHIVVSYDSDIRCGCGGIGHWEAFAGGKNLPRLAKIIAEKKKPPVETPAYRESLEGIIDPPKLFEYVRKGDLFARQVVEEMIKATIAGIASVINMYDPELITIGGSVFLYNIDILYEPIKNGVGKQIVTEKPLITPTPLKGDIVLYGALALAIHPPKHLLRIQGYI